MFFLGHISIAFVISYFIVRRFHLKDISTSLIMLFSILPDIDIVFRLMGIDLGHRSITHSLLVSMIVWGVFLIKYRKPSVMVYFFAYLSHIIIGDLIIGPLNLLYPFGHYFVNGVAEFKAPEHLVIEWVLLMIMATIVFGQYLRNRRVHIFPFGFTKLDSFFYPIVISALIISLFFLLDQSQSELTQFPSSIFLLIQSPIDYDMTTIIVMHAFGIAIVSFLWIVSRRNTRIQSRYQTPQKQQRQRL
jgi:membrane-bound metal-dependent hydrolase YbcI (DUF457 family)